MQTAGIRVVGTAPRRRAMTWIGWTVGLAALGAVVLAVVRQSEGRQLAALLERIQPAWLLVAVVLQAGTYAAQGDVWRRVMRAGGEDTSLGEACRLGFTKLFVDQAIPSAGISGTVVMGRALEQGGIPRETVMAGVVVNAISYHAANVACLAVALGILAVGGGLRPLLIAAAASFSLFVAGLAAWMLRLARRGPVTARTGLRRFPPLRKALSLFAEARADLVGNPSLLLQAGALQLAIVLLDVATLWALLGGLGAAAAPTGVFASFVVATLARAVTPIPGGLGVFEATSVGTLSLSGVALPAGLAATLLFRGVSFWLPMIPGLWFSRRIALPAGP